MLLMRKFLVLAFLSISIFTFGQTTSGLVAHYLFDGDLRDNRGNSINEGIPLTEPSFGCGINGQSLIFNGGTDELRFDGGVSTEFNNTEDFTVSIYFKARSTPGLMYLLSKQPMSCSQDSTISIRYAPLSNTINVFLKERDGRQVNIIDQLSADRCWHHVVVSRNAGRVRLYGDGSFLQEQAIIGRIDLRNFGNLILGSSDCLGQNELPFNGFMDEVRVYNRALNDNEIRDLFLAPETIATQDTVIFLGGSVPVDLQGANCSSNVTWSPISGIQNPNSASTVITPFAPGDFFYSANIFDATSSCVATDSIRITVVDPNTLDCSQAYLPSAFTPNDDGLNDSYGLSNPFAIQQLLSFEIFDRWGSRVFASVDPFQRWDGSFKSQELNPGVFRYKVRFICNGEEKENFGTLMLMR